MSAWPVDIVLVEDNEHDRELALHVLRDVVDRERIKVLRDGHAALQYLLPEADLSDHLPSPRLVLLDIKMPCVDGIEVLHRLRQEQRTRFIPVVMFTSSQQITDIADAYAGGANSYVVKPVEFERYAARLRAVVEYWLRHNVDPADAGTLE